MRTSMRTVTTAPAVARRSQYPPNMSKPVKVMKVLAKIASRKGPFWMRIGTAFQDADGTIRTYLDVAAPAGSEIRTVEAE